MKSFSIDIEAINSAAYAAGMASITAKVTLTEHTTPHKNSSELHMSEKTLRRLHQAIDKIVREIDAGGLAVNMQLP